MAKRVANEADGEAAYRKRQKITHEVPAGEDVYSGEQLRQLLAFDQDLRRARHGLQSFKRLLDDITSPSEDSGELEQKREILRDYLESVKPRSEDEDAVYLNDIMESWSFAAQVSNDGVMSSVAVVLALLLQAVSGSLTLVPHGLGVCQTLLQERQLKCLSRNLSSEKSRGFILSPTLRLLREAVCLDGGAYAKRIFRARQWTFTSLGRNLEIGYASDMVEDPKKTSVRTNAVRFVLSCIKYLHSDGRRELLSQRELFSHVTYMLRNDPPYLVLEILSTIRTYILADEKIPREVKLKCFNTKTLIRFLGLYTYGNSSQIESEKEAVHGKAHELLMYICTTPGAGILYPSTGLYPRPSEGDSKGALHMSTLANLEDSVAEDKLTEIPVYNFVLSEFAQKLKPWASLKQSELLVAVFTAAPELVAQYFLLNRSFTFEPKLTMTWIGYSAFLFNTMQIPLPSAFGDKTRYARAPPPISILLNNIIPLPVNQKVLVRCMTSKSTLTSFFATRILVLALEKLLKAVSMLQGASRSGSLWTEASRRLVDAFCQRIPDMKEIMRSYKTVPAENILHKTMASRLLRLYYEAVPRLALAANFDVSSLLVEVLRKLGNSDTESETKAFGMIEIENLVFIAGHSPGMRWFAKSNNGDGVAPFTALLRLLCLDDQYTSSKQLWRVLETVAIENQLLQQGTGLRILFLALRCAKDLDDVNDMHVIWSYVDNCIARCASSPIKYLELLHTYQAETEEPPSALASLLSVTLVEQLPFSITSLERAELKSVVRFLALYFTAAGSSKESSAMVQNLFSKVQGQLSSREITVPKLGASADLKILKSHSISAVQPQIDTSSPDEKSTRVDDSKLEEMLNVSTPASEDTSALLKWSTRSVEDLVEDGWASGLLLLLASEHTHIRKEAFTNVLKMAAKVKESSYEEKDQVWLLLSEVAESSRKQVESGPIPYSFTAFSTHAIEVLRNPLHPLYPKVNSFLTRSPVWSLEKLPLAHDILHGEPTEKDKYYTEVSWLLTFLLDSLVTPADLSVFHKKRWFEKILALGSNPYLRSNLRLRILRIIYRATRIESGSTTLITRFGIISWLDAQRAMCEVEDDAALIEALMRRIWDTCDQLRVSAWSRGGVMKLVEMLPSST